MEILFGKVPDPPVTAAPEPVDLTDDTMQEHKNKVLMAMEKRNLDILVVYADREHARIMDILQDLNLDLKKAFWFCIKMEQHF